MRILWTLFKITLGLAVAIPVGLFAMALVFGVIGTVVGLVGALVRLACFGLVGYGVYRIARFFFSSAGKRQHVGPAAPELTSVDPYYAAAMRELDSELRR